MRTKKKKIIFFLSFRCKNIIIERRKTLLKMLLKPESTLKLHTRKILIFSLIFTFPFLFSLLKITHDCPLFSFIHRLHSPSSTSGLPSNRPRNPKNPGLNHVKENNLILVELLFESLANISPSNG